MKTLNIKLRIFTGVLICLLMGNISIIAGTVTSTPTPVDAFDDIIIKSDGNVTFTASSSQGTVTLDQTFSSFKNGTPSYAGSGSTATVAVTFSDAATGLDNSCSVVVNHTIPSLSGGGTTQCTNEKPFLYNVIVPQVTFNSLATAQAEAVTLKPTFDPITSAITQAKQESGVTDSGEVTISPNDGTPYIELRLVQWINSKADDTIDTPTTFSGDDTAFDAYSTNFTQVGANQISITSSDYPGPTYNAATWHEMIPGTASFDLSAKVYMQWQIQGNSSSQWTTVGMVTWGTHDTEKPYDISGTLAFHVPGGSVDPGTGSASSATPSAPGSPTSY